MTDLYKLKIASEKVQVLQDTLTAIDNATAAIQVITPSMTSLDSIVNNVIPDLPNIDTVAGLSAEITSLVTDKATLDSILADKTTLDALYAMKATLDSIYADKTKLDSLYADKTKLDTLYTNLATINDALNQANIAATKASEASTSATNASNSASAAAISETNAANSAASVNLSSNPKTTTSNVMVDGSLVIENQIPTQDTHDIFGDASAVATYQMNGDATDLGGTYNGTATDVTYSTGKFGQSGVFNGSTSEVDCGSPFPLQGLNNFSISAWINLSTLGSLQSILDTRDANDDGAIFMVWSDNTIGMNLNASDTFSVSTIEQDVWTHIVASVDFSGNLVIYINGNNDKEVSTPSESISNATNFTIGNGSYISSLGLNGSIDQVRIFNIALTAVDVYSLYNEQKVTVGSNLNVTSGVFTYTNGKNNYGYNRKSDTFTGSVDFSGATDGIKYVAKDLSANTFNFLDSKPTVVNTAPTGAITEYQFAKDTGLIYDLTGTPITTPMSFMKNPIQVTSGTPQYIDYSDELLTNVMDSLNVGKLDMNDDVTINNLPTADPLIAGMLWNNANVITISTGV